MQHVWCTAQEFRFTRKYVGVQKLKVLQRLFHEAFNLMHTGTHLSYPWSYQWRRGVSWWSPFSSPDKGWGGGEVAAPSLLGATRSGKHRSSPGKGRSCHCGRGYRDGVLLYCVSEQFPLWAWTWRKVQGDRTEVINDERGMICGYNSPVRLHRCLFYFINREQKFKFKTLSPSIFKNRVGVERVLYLAILM